jgi:putative intracellular protease/amidase
LEVVPKYSFADAPQADIVVIPGGAYEAPSNSATAAWIKKQNAHDGHTMSVCNGAFTLANTGLLNGLKATTTAGNILRMSPAYPQIKVVNDQRVVDNGKILTTAGLSAGIDGALHMVAVLDGEDAAQTIALTLEYNWQPDNSYVRGAMADQFIPDLDLNNNAELFDMRLNATRIVGKQPIGTRPNCRLRSSSAQCRRLSKRPTLSKVRGAREVFTSPRPDR